MGCYIDCCEKCKSKEVDQNKCYHGRPCFDCPKYKKTGRIK